MRTNGYIYVLQVSGGDLDSYGEVTAIETEWSEAIPCNIKTNTDTRKGVYEDGEYRHASFTILVEKKLSYNTRRVKLERFDEELGEYDVLSCELIPGMGRMQIIV